MYCPSCHKKVQSSFAKCPYCAMSFIKESALEIKSSQGSLILSKVKKFTVISLSILGVLFILFIVWATNSTPSFTPSSTSTSEEYTNQNEEAEPEPYLEKEQSEIAIPMSDEHENNRYFLLSRTSEGNIERIIYLRKGTEYDVYGKMEINCRENKIRKASTEDQTSLDSLDIGDWYTPTPDWTDNDIVSFICN
jgi:hypothetical protein